jgi:hypothetical protein
MSSAIALTYSLEIKMLLVTFQSIQMEMVGINISLPVPVAYHSFSG